MKYPVPAILLSLLIFSCEKDITLDLQQQERRIVVDAYIEKGLPPVVLLSSDLSLYDNVDTNAIKGYGIKADKVEINDGSNTFVLTEIHYGQSTGYTSLFMKGEYGKTYKLTITKGSKVIYAYTKIPLPVKPDSITFKPKNDTSRFGLMVLHFKDPDTLGNCYRYFTKRKRKGEEFATGSFSVFEDRLINGKVFDLSIRRNTVRGEQDTTEAPGERGYFRRGDTVIVKWCTIDRANFNFWRTSAISNNSNGNPFATPVTIKSNINGGIGVWGGYGAVYDTVVAR